MTVVRIDKITNGQYLTSESVQTSSTRQHKTGNSVDDNAVNLVGQRPGVILTAGEDIDCQKPALRIAVRADMTLVDEDDGCEAGRTLSAVELCYMGMDLTDASFANTVSQNLKHPLAVVINRWRVVRVVQYDVPATRSGAAHVQAASIFRFQGD